jgi:uncharacterized protein YndB with AHSA1/START domain
MRYTDRPGARREVHIAADPARVWEIVTDVEAMTGWSPELERVEWQDGATGPAPGVRYVGHNRHPVVGEWRTTSEFTQCAPQRTLTWCVLDTEGLYSGPAKDTTAPMATWSFALTPTPGGGTALRQSVTLGPAPSGLSVFIDRAPDQEEAIIAHRLGELAKGMEATLEGIKGAAEA